MIRILDFRAIYYRNPSILAHSLEVLLEAVLECFLCLEITQVELYVNILAIELDVFLKRFVASIFRVR